MYNERNGEKHIKWGEIVVNPFFVCTFINYFDPGTQLGYVIMPNNDFNYVSRISSGSYKCRRDVRSYQKGETCEVEDYFDISLALHHNMKNVVCYEIQIKI